MSASSRWKDEKLVLKSMLTHHDGKMSVSSRWKDEKVMCIISILTHHDGKMSVSSRWKDEKLTKKTNKLTVTNTT